MPMINLPVNGFFPSIKIYDPNDTLKYEWTSGKVGTEKFDFSLAKTKLELGTGNFFGNCELTIHDPDRNLVDLTSSLASVKLEPEWRLDYYLGTSAANLTRYFSGYIREPTSLKSHQYAAIEIFAVGKASLFSDWKITRNFIQQRDTDGITPLASDTDANVSNLFKSMNNDSKNWSFPGSSGTGFTTTGVDDSSIQMSNFTKNFNDLSSIFQELANAAGANWGVDYSTMDLWMKRRGTYSSGMIVATDLDDTVVGGWDPEKVCIVQKQDKFRKYSDNSVDRGYGVYFVTGTFDPSLDWNQTSANAAHNLSTNHFAFLIEPLKNNIVSITLNVQKVGTPPDDLYLSIVGADASGKPNTSNIYRRTKIKKETLQALSTSAQNVEVSFYFDPIDINENVDYFVYINKYGNGSNYIALNYQTGAGTYYTSSDGITWGAATTGQAKIRTTYALPINLTVIDVDAIEKYTSSTTPRPRQLNLPVSGVDYTTATELVAEFAVVKSKPQRMYEQMKIKLPKTMPLPGKNVRFKDNFLGIDTYADITKIILESDSYNLGKNGITEALVELAQV